MRRRSFLHCIALTGLAVALPRQDAPGWRVLGQATQPGARLRVRMSRVLPPAAELVLSVVHTNAGERVQTTHHARQSVTAGQTVDVVTPYPYDTLVAGDYAVVVCLVDGRGNTLDSHDAGTYRVRRFRWSA